MCAAQCTVGFKALLIVFPISLRLLDPFAFQQFAFQPFALESFALESFVLESYVLDS